MISKPQDKKIVYIFGAGASKAFGYPLGKEFFHYAYRVKEFEINKSKKARHVTKLLDKVETLLPILYPQICMKIPYSDSINWPLFEEVYTFITMLNANKYSPAFSGCKSSLNSYLHAFRDLIFCTLSTCAAYGWIGDDGIFSPKGLKNLSNKTINRINNLHFFKENYFKKFLEKALQGSMPTFISLNYDTLLDSQLNRCLEKNKTKTNYNDPSIECLNYDYGFKVVNEKGKLQYGNKNILLLKPHGSLNLTFCERCKKFIWRLDSWYASMMNKRANCPCCKKYMNSPPLIPPLYGKNLESLQLAPEVTDKIKLIRDKIKDSIECAEHITIVGYSFPPYDYDFRYLFVEGLLRNPNKENIVIEVVDKEKDQAEIAVRQLKKKYAFLELMTPNVQYSYEGFLAYMSIRNGNKKVLEGIHGTDI